MKILKTYILILLTGLLIIACQEDDPITSCLDGIQNGTEIGVDCGGDCQACTILGCIDITAHNYNPSADRDDGSCQTCTDGIINGDEEEIDCGGQNCDPCLTEIEKLEGVWQQLTHTENGIDQRELYDIDDVFYHFIPSSSKFEQLTVQKEEMIKNLFKGEYGVNVNIDECWKTVNGFNTNFRYTLQASGNLRLEANIGGLIDIQTFRKIHVDLCTGVNCSNSTCHFGYCVD